MAGMMNDGRCGGPADGENVRETPAKATPDEPSWATNVANEPVPIPGPFAGACRQLRPFAGALCSVRHPTMKSFVSFRWFLGGVLAAGLCGCLSDPNRPGLTDPRQPGPAIGQAVGGTVGAVGGNVAGAVVGVGEGAAATARAPFNNTRRVIRTWRQETTSDGRVIQVPVDIEVDSLGRPLSTPKPTTR